MVAQTAIFGPFVVLYECKAVTYTLKLSGLVKLLRELEKERCFDPDGNSSFFLARIPARWGVTKVEMLIRCFMAHGQNPTFSEDGAKIKKPKLVDRILMAQLASKVGRAAVELEVLLGAKLYNLKRHPYTFDDTGFFGPYYARGPAPTSVASPAPGATTGGLVDGDDLEPANTSIHSRKEFDIVQSAWSGMCTKSLLCTHAQGDNHKGPCTIFESTKEQTATMELEADEFDLLIFGDHDLSPGLEGNLEPHCKSRRLRYVQADRINLESMRLRAGHTNRGTADGGRKEKDEFVRTYALKDAPDFRVDRKGTSAVGGAFKYQFTETCGNIVMPFINTCKLCFIGRQKGLIKTKMSNISTADHNASNKYNADDFGRIGETAEYIAAGESVFEQHVGKLSVEVLEENKDGSSNPVRVTKLQSLFHSGRSDTRVDTLNCVIHESVTVGR